MECKWDATSLYLRTTIQLYFFFSFGGPAHSFGKEPVYRGLFVYGSMEVTDYFSHCNNPLHKFFISLSLSVACIQGFGDCQTLNHRREKGI